MLCHVMFRSVQYPGLRVIHSCKVTKSPYFRNARTKGDSCLLWVAVLVMVVIRFRFHQFSMKFRRGLNRLLVIGIVIWELVLLLLMVSMRGEGDATTLIAAMLGGPLLAFGLLRAFFWILEGFKGSPLE